MRRDRSVAWISRATPVMRSIGAQHPAGDQPADAEAGEEQQPERAERVAAQQLRAARSLTCCSKSWIVHLASTAAVLVLDAADDEVLLPARHRFLVQALWPAPM